MNNYVLFSPVGDTDPVRGSYDGALLHIVRHYRPHKVYIYFTKAMQSKKDVILKAIEKFEIATEVILTEVENPSDFDIFNQEFDRLLQHIQNENAESDILLNISSGTPQMKSALCLEVVSSHLKLKPIQVLSPAKGSSKDIEHGGDIEDNYDDLEENSQYIEENRCIEPQIVSFRRTAIKRDLISLVENFEYRMALEKFKDNAYLFNKEAGELIEYARQRQNDNKEYKKSAWHKEFDFTKDENANRACDYYCLLNNNAKTGELSYFVLLLKSVIEFIADQYIGGVQETEATQILSQYYKDEYNSDYRPQVIKVQRGNKTVRFIAYSSDQYTQILKAKKYPEDDIAKFEFLNEVVKAERNFLAHDLYRVETLDTNAILKALRHLIVKTYGNKVKSQSFELYELINKKIVELL